MDRIDVLGDEYTGASIYTKELLAETDDAELQRIVEYAAAELNSPIALVSLILDQIQFFKAHVGLPDVLAAARGTHRDASFCQFVVRDGQTFEVTDGPNDPRIPQHVVKEFNIHSYLGVPIKVNEVVVGSLCVLDTKTRGFTKEEHKRLNKLSGLVNKRLAEITKSRRQARLDLTFASLHPGLTGIQDALKPIQEHLNLSYSFITSIKSFLDLSEHLFSDKVPHASSANLSLEAAMEANRLMEDHLQEIEMNVMNSVDNLNALNNLVSNLNRERLSEIVISAQDISRNATGQVGGFPLPDFESDPIIYAKANLAIALVSNCLLMISSELRALDTRDGIQLTVVERRENVVLNFSAKGLDKDAVLRVSDQLNLIIGTEHPVISLSALNKKLKLKFKTASEE